MCFWNVSLMLGCWVLLLLRELSISQACKAYAINAVSVTHLACVVKPTFGSLLLCMKPFKFMEGVSKHKRSNRYFTALLGSLPSSVLVNSNWVLPGVRIWAPIGDLWRTLLNLNEYGFKVLCFFPYLLKWVLLSFTDSDPVKRKVGKEKLNSMLLAPCRLKNVWICFNFLLFFILILIFLNCCIVNLELFDERLSLTILSYNGVKCSPAYLKLWSVK